LLRSERFDCPADTAQNKERNRVIKQILDATEGETVTADAWALFSFVNAAISEAQLYGAALMYELLKGGAR